MLQVTFVIEILVMLGLPVGLWFLLRRREGVTWGLILAGVVSFAASQLARLTIDSGFGYLVYDSEIWPFEPESTGWIVAISVYGGLAAGLCEEVARYLVLRYWRKEERTWNQGVAFGAGPRSPTINSPSLIQMVLFSMRCLKTSARQTGTETRMGVSVW